jgi:hypothetical protein
MVRTAVYRGYGFISSAEGGFPGEETLQEDGDGEDPQSEHPGAGVF